MAKFIFWGGIHKNSVSIVYKFNIALKSCYFLCISQGSSVGGA